MSQTAGFFLLPELPNPGGKYDGHLGCVIPPPDQNLADIDKLPEPRLPSPPDDPALIPSAPDPRDQITLRQVLHISSELETIDNGGMEYATGSGLSYWAGASSVNGARSRL